MLKKYAQARMQRATNEIEFLLQKQYTLSYGEDARLKRLDRSYNFWKKFS